MTLARMERALAESGPWLLGAEFTLADISILPTIVRMEDLGMKETWSGLASVARWYDAIRARESFERAYYPGSRDLSTDC